MIKVEGNVMINRSVEQVWKFLTNVNNASKWDTGIVEARQISPGPVGLGTTVKAVRDSRGRRRIMNVEVTEYDLNKRVTWKTDAGFASGKMIYTFEAVGGGTRLSKTSEVHLKGFYKLLTVFLRRRFTQSELQLDLGNIKRNVELEPNSGYQGVSQ